MSDLPEPLTPADCDLSGLEYMPLLGVQLFGSDFNMKATDSEWRAGVTLWWAAWQQVPAGSLPDDDNALCRLADLGRDLRTWRRLRGGALHGWIKCADGRLYNQTLAEQALIAWDKRVKERERKAAWRAKRQGRDHSEDGDVTRDKYGKSPGQRPGRDADVPADGTRRDGTGQLEEGSTSNDVDGEFALESANPPPAPSLKPEHFRDAWNDLAQRIGRPQCRDLTPERRQRLKARINGYSLDDFRIVLGSIEQSRFLRGDTGWPGCTFDWVTKKENFQKILEGNYNG